MVFEISHVTEYTYSDEVFFEPHFLRFKPKNTPYSYIKDFSIKIDPEPSGLSEQIDIENNHKLLCWIESTHYQLRITAKSFVEVREYNPFDFLVHPPEYLNIPFQYEMNTEQLLNPSLKTSTLPATLNDFINELLLKSNHQSITLLTELTKRIHEEFVLETRETGKPHNAGFTFEKKKGSCRDLAWMQIQMLRHIGIASRFVSGYYYIDNVNPEYELHAWVEAYLPGAGWIGFDPSHGILTNSYHIPVASSAFYENTMPISGTVRGSAKAKMKNELQISLVP